MPTHRLSLFGGFDLADDRGAPITVASKKGRCLFAYLALAPGQHTHRDILAELFWGDRDDTRARRSLSQELYRLRRLFPKETHDRFHLAGDTIGLSEDFLDVDVVRFERGLDSGEPEAIAAAAALYTGDLLAGLGAGQEGFDEWLRSERERLRDRAVAAWHDIVRTQMGGPAERAIESASRLLAIDPTSEAGHRALMRLYEKSGRRDMAVRQYERCKELLSEELGIEPDPETRELHERIGAALQTAPVEAATPGTIESAPDTGAGTDDRPPPVPDKPSIAILPFVNISGDPEQEYFSDGITEDIITALSRFHSLFVIARNSSFTYKGRAVDVKRVSAELGVRYVLEGSVRKGGPRARITAQLVEGATGAHIWAEHYDRELDDIFAVQDEITETIVAAIEPELASTERKRVLRKPPERLDAWECYQRGMSHFYQFARSGFAKARRFFERAIELDPNFGSAYAALAINDVIAYNAGYIESLETPAEMLRMAQKAVALDDRDPLAYRALAWAYTHHQGDHESAIAAMRTAVDLNPSYADAIEDLGFVCARAARY